MTHSVPACSFCHKNLLPLGNKQDSELTETTVISVSCGHIFHRSCIEKLFGDKKVVPCKNKNCDENIEKRRLKVVKFEIIVSPDAPLVAELEATINGYKVSTKANRTKIAKLTTDTRKLREEIMIKSSQFERVEKENVKIVDENKKLKAKIEECNGTIKKLKLHKLELDNVKKQNLFLVDQVEERQDKNDKFNDIMEKWKVHKSKLKSIEKENSLHIDQIKELQTENSKYIEKIKKLKQQKSKLENVEKQNLLLVNQIKELRTKNGKSNETMEKLNLQKLKLENVEKQNLLLIDQIKDLQTKNDECTDTKEKLELCNSKLEMVEKQNSYLIDQNKELHTKNEKFAEVVEEFYKQMESFEKQSFHFDNKTEEFKTVNKDCLAPIIKQTIGDIKNIGKTSTNNEIVDLMQENGKKKFELESKIVNDENLDKNIAKVRANCVNENHVRPQSLDEIGTVEKLESLKVPSTVLGKMESEKSGNMKINPFDQAKSDAIFLNLSSVLCANQGQAKAVHENLHSPHFQLHLEENPPKEKKQIKVEGFHIRENDCWDCETKKRTWNEVKERENDYTLERKVKRHEGNSSSPQQEYLRPFFLTDRKLGPFSQAVYKGEHAYTLGEYLLLGDGVIYSVLRTVLQTDENLIRRFTMSSFYCIQGSIRKFDRLLATLPYLPKKVMISIGYVDSAMNEYSYSEIKGALQSLFETIYHKGVKEIVMIPSRKYVKCHEPQDDLEFLLSIQADTAYDWKYYYMQELSNVMPDTHHITAEDNSKMMEKIVEYAGGKRSEEF